MEVTTKVKNILIHRYIMYSRSKLNSINHKKKKVCVITLCFCTLYSCLVNADKLVIKPFSLLVLLALRDLVVTVV